MHSSISVKTWVYVHIFGQIVTILWTTHLYHITIMMFIPISGRSGGGTNPEFMIGYLSVGLTVLITSYLTPLVLLLRTKKTFLWTLLIGIVLFRFVPGFLGSDFPYRDDYNRNPTPQRLFIAVRISFPVIDPRFHMMIFPFPAHQSQFLRSQWDVTEFRRWLLDARNG